MAENKKKQPAEFAKEKNAFSGGGSAKGDTAAKKPKEKQPGAHQPRDADFTSGYDNSQSMKQDGLKPERSGQPKTSGHNVQKLKNRQNRDSFQDNQNGFQSGTRKTEGQKTKPGQKKRRQPGQFQKENSFAGNKEKTDSDSAGSKAKDGFSKEQNAFTEEGGGEQGGEAKDSQDDYRRRDTYHQSGQKGRYRRREHQDRERTKKSDSRRDFQTKDTAFTKDDTFTEGAEPEFQGSKKLDRLQKKAEKAGKKTEAARKKLPKKREYSLERVFDEKTGRAKYVLTAVVKEKPFKADSPAKKIAGRAGSEFTNYAHGKVAEAEKENWAWRAHTRQSRKQRTSTAL